jgi:hypothetical protein
MALLEFRLYTGSVGFVRTNKAQRPPLDAIQTLSGVGFHAWCAPNARRLSSHDALVVDAAAMVHGDESQNQLNREYAILILVQIKSRLIRISIKRS